LRKEKNCQSCFKQMRKSSWLELRPKLKFQSIYAIFLLRVFARNDGPIEKRKEAFGSYPFLFKYSGSSCIHINAMAFDKDWPRQRPTYTPSYMLA
jgi:hypothetical protein